MIPSIANPLTARMHKGVNTTCDEGQTMLPMLANTHKASHDRHRADVEQTLVPVTVATLVSNGGAHSGYRDEHGLVPAAFDTSQITSKTNRSNPQVGDPCHTLHQGATHHIAVAFNVRGRDGGAMPEVTDVASLRAASGGSSRSYVAAMSVRRLTPKECARLQGFPDDYLDITYRNKPAADGPKYKALGNSMAVPCMAWIGRRIAQVAAIKAV